MILPTPPLGPEARARRIQELLDAWTGLSEEREILHLLRTAAPGELDEVLTGVDLDLLVHDVDDHFGAGRDYRTQMLGHLTEDRLAEVGFQNRKRLVDALQRGATSHPEEQAVTAILTGTRGAELTALKNAIDDGGDHRDLQQLVFQDVDDPALRDRILAHIAAEAATAPSGEIKVLSDIDDTFFVNWKDERYPEGTVYPGVRQYYRELDRGYWSREGHDGDVAFLTARPGDPAGLVKDRTLRAVHERGVDDATVLAGGFTNLVGRDRMARGKVANFREYHALFPEYGFTFTGDSGQADPLVGEMLLAEAPEAVRGVFIHDVVNTPPPVRDEYRRKGIMFFDTYVGAALEAHGRGLLGLDAVRRVAQAALADLAAIPFADTAQKAAREGEFRGDLARLNALLPPERQLPTP